MDIRPLSYRVTIDDIAEDSFFAEDYDGEPVVITITVYDDGTVWVEHGNFALCRNSGWTYLTGKRYEPPVYSFRSLKEALVAVRKEEEKSLPKDLRSVFKRAKKELPSRQKVGAALLACGIAMALKLLGIF